MWWEGQTQSQPAAAEVQASSRRRGAQRGCGGRARAAIPCPAPSPGPRALPTACPARAFLNFLPHLPEKQYWMGVSSVWGLSCINGAATGPGWHKTRLFFSGGRQDVGSTGSRALGQGASWLLAPLHGNS